VAYQRIYSKEYRILKNNADCIYQKVKPKAIPTEPYVFQDFGSLNITNSNYKHYKRTDNILKTDNIFFGYLCHK